MMNHRTWLAVVGLGCLLGVAGAAPAQTPEATGEHPQGEAVMSTVVVTATVTKIDQKTREVELRTEDGLLHTIIAGDEVKNLAQVEVGDVISATYVEALAYEVKKGGNGEAARAGVAAAAAEPGARPAAAIAAQVAVTVTITAIDAEVPSVTFKRPDGSTRTIKVLHQEKLQGVNVGDSVEITYSEALALKVEAAAKP